jgi:hypothetical protein
LVQPLLLGGVALVAILLCRRGSRLKSKAQLRLREEAFSCFVVSFTATSTAAPGVGRRRRADME